MVSQLYQLQTSLVSSFPTLSQLPRQKGRCIGKEEKKGTGVGPPAIRWHTFIAVTDGVKVDVVLVVADEEQAEPGVEGVHGHDEQYADDVALFVWHRVRPQVCVYLSVEKSMEKDKRTKDMNWMKTQCSSLP